MSVSFSRPTLLSAGLILAPVAALAQAAAAPPAPDAAASAPERIEVTGQRDDPEFGLKSGVPLSRLPQSVQSLGAEQITASGARSVGEVLRAVPGANPGNSRVARYQSFSLKVRGFLADQMRNGIRQRYHEDVDASALANVERIDVLKGPSAALFGQSAIGGILAISTRQPQATFAAEGAFTVGSDDQRVARVDLTGPLAADGRLSARLTAEVERSGTFVDFQDINRDNLALALRWAPTPAVTMHLLAESIERRTLGNPGLPVAGTVAPGGTGDLPRSLYLGEPFIKGLGARGTLVQWWTDIDLGGGWTLTPRWQFQPFDSAFSQVRVREMGADGVTLQRNGRLGSEDDIYRIAQLDLQGTLRTGGVDHHLLLGLEASREHSTFVQETITNVGPIDVRAPVYTFPAVALQTTPAFDFRGDTRGSAIALQDRIALTPALDLLAAWRFSRFDTTQTFVPDTDRSRTDGRTGQLGVNWRATPRWTVFGGVGTGFDVENVLGARARDGRPFVPETSRQVEAGVRFADARHRASLAVFDLRRQDALTTDPLDPDFSVQDGEQRVRGLEFEGETEPAPGWTLAGGYAWMQGRVTRSNDGDQGAELGDTPRHTLTLRTRVALADSGWSLRGALSAVSARRLVNGSSIVLPGYALLDLGVGWRGGRWSADLTLNNAADRRYFTATGNAFGVYPGDPRQLSLRIGATL